MVAAGVFAPAATATPVLQEFLKTLGAFGLGEIGQALGGWRKRRSGAPAALLRNHDLQLLVATALEKALLLAADEPDFKKQAKEIGWLAKEAAGYLGEASPEALMDGALPGVVERYAASAKEGKPAAAVEDEVWLTVVRELKERARTKQIDPVEDALAAHLSATFERFVIEVFKEDATGKGPAEGRGWAALELLFWGMLRADVQALQTGLGEAVGLARKQEKALAEVDGKLDQLIERHEAEVVLDHPELMALLRSVREDLVARLDEIADLLTNALWTLEQFEEDYWLEKRADPRLQRLWSDPDRARTLTWKLVGRDEDLKAFDAFLEGPSPWVLHRHGSPGNGKSRLMIAFAQRAAELGRRAYFIAPDPANLNGALKKLGEGPPVVLLWDDYRGGYDDAMRSFLGLNARHGAVIKRVVTTWPTVEVFKDQGHKPHYRPEPLAPVKKPEAMLELTRALLDIDAKGAERIVRLAEGHPEAVLIAADMILSGEHTAENLPVNLLKKSDDGVLSRAIYDVGLEREVARRALLALALTERVDWADKAQREAYARSGVEEETLGILQHFGLVAKSRDGRVYSLKPDRFRIHVIWRALSGENARLITLEPEELAERAAPLLELWVDAIWGVCVQATGGANGDDRRVAVQRALLDGIVRVECETDERALAFAMRIVNATAVEPDARRREELAERIGQVRERHDTAEIALQEAKALFNATVGEPDEGRCEQLAERIRQVRERHGTAEIALAEAQALHNATVVEPDAGRREKLAARIGRVRERHDTAEIALAEAKALHNATAVEPDAGRCEKLAERIGRVRERHDTAEMALEEAKALYNATVGEPDAGRRAKLAERIGQVRERHDTAEIALREAKALYNATAGEPDAGRREKLAERIGRVRERHDTAEIALEEATALFNATVGEPDAGRCEQLAERIGQVRERHDTAEIALEEAKALFNATVVEPDAGRREQLADRIGPVRRRHDTAEIARLEAQALQGAAGVEQDGDRCLALADRIARIRKTRETPEIATEEAFALGLAASRRQNVAWCLQLAERIGRLRERYGLKMIALAEGFALENAMEAETDAGRREQLQGRIEALVERYGLMDGADAAQGGEAESGAG